MLVSCFLSLSQSAGIISVNQPVRVTVPARRSTMSGPASVSNTSMGLKGLGEIGLGLFNEFLQLSDLANFLEGTDFLLLVAIDCETG